MIAGCPVCRTTYKIHTLKIGGDGVNLRCGACPTVFRITGQGRRSPRYTPDGLEKVSLQRRMLVLVAHENPSICFQVRKVLPLERFAIVAFDDGVEVMESIPRLKPDFVLLDVALPGKYGFEICDEIKRNPETASIKTIIVASTSGKPRHRREPESMYGADALIEYHQLTKNLSAVIGRLLAHRNAASQDLEHETDDYCFDFGNEEECGESGASGYTLEQLCARNAELDRYDSLPITPVEDLLAPDLSKEYRKAARLARIIAAEIALYNREAVEIAVRCGGFYEMMAEFVSEGWAYYEKRISEEIRESTSYMEDAFEELIVKVRGELCMG